MGRTGLVVTCFRKSANGLRFFPLWPSLDIDSPAAKRVTPSTVGCRMVYRRVGVVSPSSFACHSLAGVRLPRLMNRKGWMRKCRTFLLTSLHLAKNTLPRLRVGRPSQRASSNTKLPKPSRSTQTQGCVSSGRSKTAAESRGGCRTRVKEAFCCSG